MPFTVTMPKLSPTMEEGTLAKWRKKEGDFVKAGEVMFEVATDKATVEHSALDAGFLRKILIKEGESAIVNQPVAIFSEKKDESIEGYKPEGAAPQVAAAPPAKSEAKPEMPAQKAAAVMAQPAFVPEAPLSGYKYEGATPAVRGRIPASPLAKRLAKEKGIDLSTVHGSGPGQRVMSSDLPTGQPDLAVTFGRSEMPELAPGTFEEEAMSPIRKVIAQRLQASKSFVPHFYASQDIRADALVSLRDQLKNGGLKVSVNDFVLRACALALREHPEINSGYNSATQSIIRFKTIDISVAVNVPQGLITPIVRHADFKNLGELSTEVKLLAGRAKEGKLAREEYMGGSFTLSNLGMFGITEFVAIINPPQAAILAVGAIEDRAVVDAGVVKAGKLMKVTLSGDHRVIDGSDGAKFLKTVQKYLENPALLVV